MREITRTRWAAVGAAVAITLGAGGVSMTQAARTADPKPVFVSLDAPCRLVDTRPTSQVGVKNTPIAAGDAEAYTIQVTGDSGNCTAALAVPADAVGVALNVTAIAPVAPTTGRSFFTVYPAGATRPTTSNLNFLNGQAPVPNKVDVGLGSGGKITIYNNEGTSHAAVDVFGYYVDHDHTGADIVDESLTGADVDDGTLTNADLKDEPGVAYTFTSTATGLTDATIKRVGSTSIRVPADGYVVVHATGYFVSNAAGVDAAYCQLTKGAIPGSLSIGAWPFADLSDFGSSGVQGGSFSTHAVFDMDVADNPLSFFTGQTIGLDCLRISGSLTVDDVQVTMTYFPRSYAPIGFIMP